MIKTTLQKMRYAKLSIFLYTFLILIISSCKKKDPDISSLYHNDGEISKLYFNSEQGINIVVLGDGFIGEDLKKGGIYDSTVKEVIGQLFTIPPFKQYKKSFNTYVVYSESKRRGLNNIDDNLETKTKFSTYFSGALRVGNYDLCYEYVKKAVPISKANLIILIANDANFDAASGGSIALITTGKYSKLNLAHEVGHTFAGLGDEYVSPEIAVGFPLEFIYSYPNLDVTNDPEKVKWSHYLKNKAYNNVVGIFEGGYYREKGVYRPEKSSLMDGRLENLHFNVPSREAIVRKIHQILNVPFDMDKFLKDDDASTLSIPPGLQGTHKALVNDFIGIEDRLTEVKKEE